MKRTAIAALVAAAWAGGCKRGPDPVPTAISIPVDRVVLGKRQGAKLSAAVVDQTGAAMELPILWKTSDPGIVTVSDEGDLVAVDEGPALVWARAEYLVATVRVDVVERLSVEVVQSDTLVTGTGDDVCQYALTAVGVGGPPGDSATWAESALEFLGDADTVVAVAVGQAEMTDRFGRLVIRRGDTLSTRLLAVTPLADYRLVNRIRYTVGDEPRSLTVPVYCPQVERGTRAYDTGPAPPTGSAASQRPDTVSFRELASTRRQP